MRGVRTLTLALLLLGLLALTTAAEEAKGKEEEKTDKKSDADDEDDDEYQEEYEEELAPFAIKRLSYKFQLDDFDPNYHKLIGVTRLTPIRKVRSAFRQEAAKFREVLMGTGYRAGLREEPHRKRKNSTDQGVQELREPGQSLNSALNASNASGANETESSTNQTEAEGLGPEGLRAESLGAEGVTANSTAANVTNGTQADSNSTKAPGKTPEEIRAEHQAAELRKKKYKEEVLRRQHFKRRYDTFMNLTEAYRILTNPLTKRVYEVSGMRGLIGKDKPKFDDPLRNPYKMEMNFGTGNFKIDFGFKEGQAKTTGNVHHNIKIPLIGFYTGFHMDVGIVRGELCPFCNGSGASQEAQMLACHDCKGSGKEEKVHYWQKLRKGKEGGKTRSMETSVVTACKRCDGSGKLASEPCPRCSGKKTLEGKVTVTVNIEPGMLEGHTFTFKEHAEQVPDTVSGDVLLHVYAEEHEEFEREGHDLVTYQNISLMEALMGFSREIKHLDGRLITIERSEVTKPGQQHEVPGLGMPIHKKPGEFGKLIVKLSIQFPERIAVDEDRARELRKADERAKRRKTNRFSAEDDPEYVDDEDIEDEVEEEEEDSEDEDDAARTQRLRRRAAKLPNQDGEIEEEEEEEDEEDEDPDSGRTRGGTGAEPKQEAKPVVKRGVGMYVEPEFEENDAGEKTQVGLRVKKLLPGSPAEANGRIQVGDLLMEVGGVKVAKMKLKDVAVHLVGAEGSLVHLKMLRGEEEFEVSIPRGEVKAPPKAEL